MQSMQVLAAAARLLDQRLSLTPIIDMPAEMRPQTEAQGYALQRALNALLAIAGMGPQGVFVAVTLSFSAMAVVSAVLFRRGRWKHQRV